jgi:hypothetical protein
MVQGPPLVYQLIGGEKRVVGGSYVIDKSGEVGFALAEYNQTARLVINRVTEFSTVAGGSGQEDNVSIEVDAQGYASIAGKSPGLEFPTIAGSFQPSVAGDDNIVVYKLDPTGSQLMGEDTRRLPIDEEVDAIA